HVAAGAARSREGGSTRARAHPALLCSWKPDAVPRLGNHMTDHMPDDLSADGRDLRAFADQLRPRHGVVRNVRGEWVLLRHDLVVQAARDHARFSSAVSRHLHVPNGIAATRMPPGAGPSTAS